VDDGGWENSVSGKVRGQSWSKHLFRQLGLTNTLLVQSVRTDAAVVLMAGASEPYGSTMNCWLLVSVPEGVFTVT
jgi:hypothetical protein